MNLHDVTDGLLGLAVIAGAVGVVALFGRDRTADQHDLSDYHESAPVNDAPPSLRRYEALDSQPLPATMRVRYDFDISPEMAGDILPPAPAGMDAGAPLYAGMLFDSWHPETPAATAARFLRELGDQAKAKTADRDMTGAFPVVRAA